MLAHLKGIWAFRYFWISLVKMDVMTRYRRSVLGIGWSLLHPLAMTAVFCLVFSNIMNMGSGWVEYAQATLAAMAVWAFMRDTTLQGCFALIRSEAYIRQVPLPYGVYSLRTMLANLVHYLITLVVVICLVAVLQGTVRPFLYLWAVVFAVVLTAVFVWALATLASFITVYFHDISHMMELAAQVMFFLTPIIYRKENLKSLMWLSDVNPIVPFLEITCDPIVKGVFPDFGVYAYAISLTVGSVGLAIGVIAWLQKKVIFHM